MTTLIEQTTTTRTPSPVPSRVPASGGPARVRDASVDVARAWCLVVVVGLHALMVGVSIADGAPVLENAMDGWGGFAALTWLAQVMPLFFVLGGFSSATQWARLRERGVPPHRYLAMRLRRLLPSALGAMGATAMVLAALVVAGVPDDVVAIAGFRMSQPLWFLGVYLLCTALVPLMTAAHRAAPRATVGALTVLVVCVDAARIGTGVAALGFANLLFVWLLLQQLGFSLADGGTRARRRSLLAVAGAALGVLAVLCASGLYSVDLLENLNPPTAALVLLGVVQLCVFDLARPALRRLHGIRPLASTVGAVNARAMTIYSWHMLVLIGLAGVLLVSVGEALPAPLTDAWWAGRPAWFAAVAVGVVLVVAIAGRREAASGARQPAEPARHPAAVAAAVLVAAAGVVAVLLLGSSPLAWVAGAALLAGALSAATRPTRP
jgi:peptidoglycan/LPS O-acetylase OafA/YrhL